MAKDFSRTSNFQLPLPLLYPIISLLASVFLLYASGQLAKHWEKGSSVSRWSNILSILVLVLIAFGAATLLTLAPILMQLGHLLLADAIWIVFVLMTADFLAGKPAFYDPANNSESVAT